MEKGKLNSRLGYTAAVFTLVIAAMTPFFLFGLFAKGFSSMGLHVDEMYSGGPRVRTLDRAGYSIGIHRQVSPHMLQREKPFVQLDWKPVAALPSHVSDRVDIDGDGTPDVAVDFDVPRDSKATLRVNVQPLNPRFESMTNVGKTNFSALIVRVDDEILVRVPVTQ